MDSTSKGCQSSFSFDKTQDIELPEINQTKLTEEPSFLLKRQNMRKLEPSKHIIDRCKKQGEYNKPRPDWMLNVKDRYDSVGERPKKNRQAASTER
mgnify:CR=1 FL=1